MKYRNFILTLLLLIQLMYSFSLDDFVIVEEKTKLECTIKLRKNNSSYFLYQNQHTRLQQEKLKKLHLSKQQGRLLNSNTTNQESVTINQTLDEGYKEIDEGDINEQIDISEFKKKPIKKDERKQKFISWSTPKQLIKIVKHLNDDEIEKITEEEEEKENEDESKQITYSQIFSGENFQVTAYCQINGSHFRIEQEYSMNCKNTRKAWFYISQANTKRRKIQINLSDFYTREENNPDIEKDAYTFSHEFNPNVKPKVSINENICFVEISHIKIFFVFFKLLFLLTNQLQ